MIEINRYGMLAKVHQMYKNYDELENFDKRFSGSVVRQEYRDITFSYLDDEPVSIDDPRLILVRQELKNKLPTRKSKPPEYDASEEDVVLPIEWDSLCCLHNVAPKPAGYFWRKDSNAAPLNQVERACLQRVQDFLYDEKFWEQGEYFSYLKRSSSVGVPFHRNDVEAKVTAIRLGYEILSHMSSTTHKSNKDFVQKMFNKFSFISMYMTNFRIQIDKRDKLRYADTADGNRVEVDRSIPADHPVYKILKEKYKQLGYDIKLLRDFEPYAGRYRNIASGPSINSLASLLARPLIAHRKTKFPFLVDDGPEKNLSEMVSERMEYTGSAPIDDKIIWIAIDINAYDSNWHSEIFESMYTGFDNVAPRPWNVLKPLLFGSPVASRPHEFVDASRRGFITHDPFVEEIEHTNYHSHASGEPLTKPANDFASTWIVETILARAGLPSLLENFENLMTREFPISLKINGDDILLAVRNQEWANKIVAQLGKNFADWKVSPEIPVKWNNMYIVKSEGQYKFRRNLESYIHKLFIRETSFGFTPAGAEKEYPSLGYYLRQLAYDSPFFPQVQSIVEETVEKIFRRKLSEFFILSEKEHEIMKGVQDNPAEAVNIALFLDDPDKLHYITSLWDIPEAVKQIHYYSFTPEDIRRIISAAEQKASFPKLEGI